MKCIKLVTYNDSKSSDNNIKKIITLKKKRLSLLVGEY